MGVKRLLHKNKLTDRDVEKTVLLVSVAEKRNAVSHKQEEDRVTCIRRRQATTHQTTFLEKEQITHINYLHLVIKSTLFHRFVLPMFFSQFNL